MTVEKCFTIKDAFDSWNKVHPDCPVTASAIRGWARKFGWILNSDRLIKKQKIQLDASKFNKFNKSPQDFLQ